MAAIRRAIRTAAARSYPSARRAIAAELASIRELRQLLDQEEERRRLGSLSNDEIDRLR